MAKITKEFYPKSINDEFDETAKDILKTSFKKKVKYGKNVLIGKTNQNSYLFSGNIDEVAIFDYALSARQIKQDIYNGTTSGKTADLNNISNLTPPVAWYRMGD